MLLYGVLFSAAACALLVVAVIGATLPSRVEAAAEVALPGALTRPESALHDIGRWPSWFPHVRAVQLEDAVNWREVGPTGAFNVQRVLETDALLETVKQGERLVGTRRWTLRKHGSGVIVHLATTRQVPNVLSRFRRRYISAQAADERAILEALGRHLGERVTATVASAGASHERP